MGNLECDVFFANPWATDEQLAKLLSSEELERSRQFVNRLDRLRFMTGRLLVRYALSERLAVTPAEIQIVQTCFICGAPHGKPRLSTGEWQFSISHAGEYVVVAITSQSRVGIDIEPIDASLCVSDLINLVLTKEEQDVFYTCPIEQSVQVFLRYWTRKEALLKCLGLGLTVAPNTLALTPPSSASAITVWPQHWVHGSRFHFRTLIS